MITVQPRREDALRVGFESLAERIDIGYEAFCRALADWEVSAFCDGDKPVGMLMVKGAELHVAVLPEVRGKWLSRRLIREVFKPIIDKHKQAKTAVMADNAVGLDFVRRIRRGFADLTFDPVTALVSVGGSLLGGALQAGAAKSAAKTAANAQEYSADVQRDMFNVQNAQQAPWRQTGGAALSEINRGFGLQTPDAFDNAAYFKSRPDVAADPYFGSRPMGGYEHYMSSGRAEGTPFAWNQAQSGSVAPGYFAHQFGASDLNANMAPNWAFSLDQGQRAAKNALNLTGGMGGNFGKGLVDYTIGKAGDLYQQAYNNYTANQSNIFNRLSNVAGFGSGANQTSAQLAGSLGPSIGSAYAGAGAAQAAGTVGAANALAGGANNALGWYQLSNMMTPSAAASYGGYGYNPAMTGGAMDYSNGGQMYYEG